MRVGLLSDTHDEFARTAAAIGRLRDAGAKALVHCGDLSSPPIVALLAELPSWFVLGNHDADNVPALMEAAGKHGVNCLGWGGVIKLAGIRLGVVHGHLRTDLQHVLSLEPQILVSGHAHAPWDFQDGPTRRINPGALHRSDAFTAMVLDLATGLIELHTVD